MDRLVLASASPRRRELLEKAVSHFDLRPTDADETLPRGIDPAEAACMLARRKAQAAVREGAAEWILGSDTIVTVEGMILGKPQDRGDAERMLRLLSGRTHQVYTAALLFHSETGQESLVCDRADVTFAELDEGDLETYLSTDEPYDKAGAYGIQGRGALFIRRIEGDYTNVMGLPMAALYPVLKARGLADSCRKESKS